MPVGTIVLRLPKGSPLTPAEMDSNLDNLRDFSDALETLFLVGHAADGTHKAGAIDSGSYAVATLATSPDVYNLTLSPAPSAYTTGMVVRFKAGTGCNGATNLNVNSLGSKDLFSRAGSELAAGDIATGQLVEAVYDGTSFLCHALYTLTASAVSESLRMDVQEYAPGTLTGGTYYAVPLSPAATTFTAGMVVRFLADAANTGSVNLKLNALAEKDLLKNVNKELAAGDIKAGQMVEAVYDGTAFQATSILTRNGADFTSAETAISATKGVTLNVVHGLGATPSRVRCVLVCQPAGDELGYVAGDEVDLFSLQPVDPNEVAVGANSTNVWVIQSRDTNLTIVSKAATYGTANITLANWKFKVYAWL